MVLESLTAQLPGWQLIVFVALFLIFLVTGAIIAFVIIYRLRWPMQYRVLENVAGLGYIPTKKGRCRLVGFGDGGEELFYLKNLKKYKAGYGKRIGKNQIAWGIGQDGYWYNVTFGDLDKKLLEIGVMPVDRDMRYATASIRKGIEHRYNEKNFMEKWGATITIGMLIIAIIAMGISNYYVIKKVNEGISTSGDVAKTNKETMQLANQVLSNVANIKQGGTGFTTGT